MKPRGPPTHASASCIWTRVRARAFARADVSVTSRNIGWLGRRALHLGATVTVCKAACVRLQQAWLVNRGVSPHVGQGELCSGRRYASYDARLGVSPPDIVYSRTDPDKLWLMSSGRLAACWRSEKDGIEPAGA